MWQPEHTPKCGHQEMEQRRCRMQQLTGKILLSQQSIKVKFKIREHVSTFCKNNAWQRNQNTNLQKAKTQQHPSMLLQHRTCAH